ncbi:hypothetical protein CAPTEDRAFT_171528 [Capitella teleta]|uniref:K Homology domain-containing protein n=1 Tax=Capitella teleta TaxID=283909 RepID=R7TCA8_CAPTE|nr:hypothetical protein CAPTEDRAFT_171528 [Capitella teleta]|eukprot:ELT89137.1 hypothetical protein CAPTEDRAFT_171528 [Capitella teleta]
MKRSLEEDNTIGDVPLKKTRGEGPNVELRILLQSKNAGAIIGKGGANIKRLRSDYNATVTVPDSSGPERVLTVGANLGTALEILLDVIPSLEDYKRFKDLEFECEMRWLIHQSQAGCVIGRGGNKIKELRDETGAQIKVYSQCAPQSSERIVQLTGKPRVVVNSLATIFDLLQTAPPKGFNNPYDPNNFDEFYAPEYGGYTQFEDPSARGGGGRGMRGGNVGGMRGRGGDMRRGGGMRGGGGRGGMGDGMGRGGGRGGRGGGGGMGMRGGFQDDTFGGGMATGNVGGGGGGANNFASDSMDNIFMQSGNQGMMFGNSNSNQQSQSTQVSIPKDLAGAIIGKGGSRIRQIRQESGAGINIDEPMQGSQDRIITITGSQDQIQNAQYLLQMSVKQYSGRY